MGSIAGKTTTARQRSWKRWLKFKYTLLLRAKGGASSVALGFAVGIAVEMFTLPTAGLAFFLIFPLVYFFRASLAAALIGFVFGKLIYIPLAFLNGMVGGWILPEQMAINISFLPGWLNGFLLVNLKLIVGGVIDGALLGALFYLPVKYSIQYMADKRREKQRNQHLNREIRPAKET
jgi:uncharacterized protein (DUF2062 family)